MSIFAKPVADISAPDLLEAYVFREHDGWASDLWVQASLNQRQRLQQLFFPEGLAFDGKQFGRTGATANAFRNLTAADSSQNNLASLMPASWNQIVPWLRQIDRFRRAE